MTLGKHFASVQDLIGDPRKNTVNTVYYPPISAGTRPAIPFIMNESRRRVILPFLIFSAAITLTGCGPSLGVDESQNEMGENAYSFYQQTDATYTCPTSENIVPADDRALEDLPRYTACTHRSDASKVKLVGYSSTSRMICVFPVQYISGTQFVYKFDAAYQPMYQCHDGWADQHAKELSFPYTNFNGVVVVDEGLRPQMSSALVAGSALPMHAMGKFR